MPAVYLRGFCDKAGKLHLYDFVKKEFRSNIKPEKIATRNHIYTIIHNGAKDYRIENFFSEIETKYGAVTRLIENGRIEHLPEMIFSILFGSFLFCMLGIYLKLIGFLKCRRSCYLLWVTDF